MSFKIIKTCLILFIAIINNSAVISAETPVKACGDGNSLPTSVSVFSPVGNLCTESICDVHSNTDLGIDVTFVADGFIETLKPRIFALALGVSIEWQDVPSDGCELVTNTICPIVSGETINYYQTMHIGQFPTVDDVQLTIILQDSTVGSNVTCFVYDISVK